MSIATFTPGPYLLGQEVEYNGQIWIARKDIKYASAPPRAGAYWILKPEPVIDKDAVIKDLTAVNAALTIVTGEQNKILDTLLSSITQLPALPASLRMIGTLINQQGGIPQTPPNTPPTANAGAAQTITLPTSSVTANGSGTDLEGPVTFTWKQTIGPKPAAISNPAIAKPVFSGLTQAGTYEFELTVTDAGGLTAVSKVLVIVNPEPVTEPTPGIPLPDYTDYEVQAFTSPGTPLTLATTIAEIPTQISNLRITGVPKVGETLTAVTDSAGAYTYQWIISDSNGLNPAFIEGATANTYGPIPADEVGYRYSVQASFKGLTVTSLKTATVPAPNNWVSENGVFNTTGLTFRTTRGILGNGRIEFKLTNPDALSGFVGADQGIFYPANGFEANYIFTLNDAATGKGFVVREQAGSNIFSAPGDKLITYYWEIEQTVLTSTTGIIRYRYKKLQNDVAVTIWESTKKSNPSSPLYFVAYLATGQGVQDVKLWAEPGKFANVS